MIEERSKKNQRNKPTNDKNLFNPSKLKKNEKMKKMKMVINRFLLIPNKWI